MRLSEDLERWNRHGVDYIQLREKDLAAGEVFWLARNAMQRLREAGGRDGSRPRLLVNARPDLAAAAGADGVHLTGRAGELTPAQARKIFQSAGLPGCTVSVSCHSPEDVEAARVGGADLILFSPVFGKKVQGAEVGAPVGLQALAQAVHAAVDIPVLALGGVTEGNTALCLEAGAAGIAAIRQFAAAWESEPQ